MLDPEILGFALIRLGVAYIFLWAAFQNTRNRASWDWTIDNTAILFQGTALKDNRRLMALCAFAGMVVMYGGGLAILLGIEVRPAALALALFTISGAIIHNRVKQMALDTGEALKAKIDEAAAAQVDELAWSAFAGNHSSALKNWGLVPILFFFVAVGAGPDTITLSDWTGAWLGL